MAASEIGFNRDAFGCPPVREADGTGGVGPHRPSGYCNLEPIVHQPLPLTPGNLRPGLHPDILTCRRSIVMSWLTVVPAMSCAVGPTRLAAQVLRGGG